jgi:Resolvase, N terminal domain
VRFTAPLVAALLWERVLTAARREHEARSLVQVRRDHRLIAVAQAALTVRQLSEDRRDGRRQTARLRRARRRLQRAHVTALPMIGVGPDLFEVLAAVGAVDILPAVTIPTGRPDTRPDTGSDTLAGDDTAMATLLLSVMGAFAEFERALIRERQREGIELAKKRGVYRGCRRSLSEEQVTELRQRAGAGAAKGNTGS